MSTKLKNIRLGTEMMSAEETVAALGTKQDVLGGSRLSAVTSGITKAKVDSYSNHVADTSKHVTSSDKARWNSSQVNVIEKIKVNGVEVPVEFKTVNISVPSLETSATKEDLARKLDKTTYYSDKANFATQIDLETKQDRLTDSQAAAANSGVTGQKVAGYDGHVSNFGIHVTVSDKARWNSSQENVIESVKVNGTAVPVNNKSVNITIPTLENVATKADLNAKVSTDVFASAMQRKQDSLNIQQIEAANSGITVQKVGEFTAHVGSSQIHVTSTDKATWNGHVSNQNAHVTLSDKTRWNGGLVSAAEKEMIANSVQTVKVNGVSVRKENNVVNIPVPSTEDLCTKQEFRELEDEVDGKVGRDEYESKTSSIDAEIADISSTLEGKQDSLSQVQMAAVNSGATADLVTSFGNRLSTLESQIGDLPAILSAVLGE